MNTNFVERTYLFHQVENPFNEKRFILFFKKYLLNIFQIQLCFVFVCGSLASISNLRKRNQKIFYMSLNSTLEKEDVILLI